MSEKPPKFEESLQELETLIDDLESGELTLDESLERYERGIKALTACRKILGQAEQKIQLLIRTSQGGLKTQPFDEKEIIEAEPETDAGSSEETDEDDQIPF